MCVLGQEHKRRDLEQNTIVTFNVLDAMRANGVRQIAFISTASIYGEAQIIPTPEKKATFPFKHLFMERPNWASEGFIEAHCEGFDFRAWIFRFCLHVGGTLYARSRHPISTSSFDLTPNELRASWRRQSQRKSVPICSGLYRTPRSWPIERAHVKVNLFQPRYRRVLFG